LGGAEVILLDTHVLIWMVSDSSRLSRTATRELRKAEQNGELAIASITLWELALLYYHGRLRTSGSTESAIRETLEKSQVQVIEVTPEIAALTTTFPDTYPKDPGDRLIGATARAFGLMLITQDQRILASPLIRAVW
jgi:PIN domain nuclease of toxin-antitoxin system